MKEGVSVYNENNNVTNMSMNLMMTRISPDYIRECARNCDLSGDEDRSDEEHLKELEGREWTEDEFSESH
jgi:hypothetical protein